MGPECGRIGLRVRITLGLLAVTLLPLLVAPSCAGIGSGGDGANTDTSVSGSTPEDGSSTSTDGTGTDGSVDGSTSEDTTSPSEDNTTPDDSSGTTGVTITHTIHVGDALSGKTIRPLLGVNAGPLGIATDTTSTDLTNLYKQMGVTFVRTHDNSGPLDMATIYPDQSADPSLEASYDFTASDTYYTAILAGGFEPYLRLGDSASTAAGYPAPSPRAPTNVAHWVAAAVHVVQHYNDATRWGRSPIHYIEIWNEPDSTHFWDSTRNSFVNLFSQTAIALKAAYPSLKIGGPGFTSAAYMNSTGQGWLVALLDYCQAHSVPLDFLSWHTYTNDPETLVTAATWFRGQLDSHGYTATESHITEWNTDAASVRSTSVEEVVALRSGARGAAVATACWIRLQEQNVDLSMFYRGRDPQLDHTEMYGLLSGTGQIKKSGLAFVLWSQLANSFSTRLDVSVDTSSSTTLYALAGRAADGSVAVLLANTSDQALECQLAGYSSSVDVWRVSDTATMTEHTTASPSGFDMPAYSVQLVVTSP